ncbi:MULTISPECIES: hypothetical protein [Pseudomonas]|nr:hypothetical protein [Pseudomonas lactis]
MSACYRAAEFDRACRCDGYREVNMLKRYYNTTAEELVAKLA